MDNLPTVMLPLPHHLPITLLLPPLPPKDLPSSHSETTTTTVVTALPAPPVPKILETSLEKESEPSPSSGVSVCSSSVYPSGATPYAVMDAKIQNSSVSNANKSKAKSQPIAVDYHPTLF